MRNTAVFKGKHGSSTSQVSITSIVLQNTGSTSAAIGETQNVTQKSVKSVKNLTNIARRGDASASSYRPNCHPRLAIDGNRQGNINSGVFHNKPGGDIKPFWNLNLLKSYEIHQVTIFNRLDCCQGMFI